jgi:DNA invertase Pin-like site-specific DNA recombinase
MLVGYARCSTDAQDLTAQRDALTALGVKPNRIYVDHGLTGTNRARPGLREALAACRSGDTLVVTKLDRLARSLTDARDIVEELTEAGVKLNIGGSIHDPTDPVGRLLFNVLGMIAEFESDLIRMRTREGMKVAKAKGPTAWQAAQAQARPGSAPRRAVASGQAHQRRTRRAVLRRPLHRVPRDAACRRAEARGAATRVTAGPR